MPFGFFDDFAEDFFSGFITYVFNGTEVTTGVASSLVYPEGTQPNTVNEVLMKSLITGTDFQDEFMKKLNGSSFPAFKNRFEPEDFKGYISGSTLEFPNFVRDNLPNSLLSFPHGPARDYLDFYNYSPRSVYIGKKPLRFESWLYSYLWDQYRYDPIQNNVYDKTYAKGTWVGVKKVDVFVPNAVVDYPPDFFNQVLSQFHFVPTGDKSVRGSVVTVHYEATTTTTTAYTVPTLSDPVMLEGAYTVPAVSDPVVLSGETATVPADPYINITYEWRPGGHRSTNPIEESTETVAIPAWVFTTTASYWQLATTMLLNWTGSTETRLIGPNDDWNSRDQMVTFYWLYENGTGVYPAWDNYTGSTDLESGTSSDEKYVNPIYAGTHYIGNGNYALVDSETSPEAYDNWVTQAKKYSLNPDEILTQLEGSIDLTDNYSTVFEMGVPINTSDPKLLKYVYKLFKHWNSQTTYVPTYDFGNMDKITSLRFSKMRLRREYFFTGISTEIKAGTFSTAAKKGEYLRVISSFNETFTDDLRGETYSGAWQGIKFYHQVTDNTYEVLRIGHPLCAYDSARGEIFGAEPTDERFILPLHTDIAWDMGTIDFEYLVYKSMRLTQVIAVTRRISWMELEFVQDMFKMIQLGLKIFQYWGYAAGVYNIMTGLAVNFITAVLIAAMLNYGVDAALDLIIQELGIEASLIIAVMLAGAGLAMGINGTEFMGGLIDGTLLLSAGNNLVTLVNEERMESVKAGYTQLEYDREEFGEFYDEQVKEIEEARDLLNQPNHVSPYLFIGKAPMQIWGEGPQSFYERTVHSGNIGTKAFDFVHNYVGQKLTLPSFEQSVGDTLYDS